MLGRGLKLFAIRVGKAVDALADHASKTVDSSFGGFSHHGF
jgi:hypothetical protein